MKRSILIQRGVSLIEALVAMAIMAFGMLALLGLQGALRGNSDVSKQRSEAVRYAQEQIELLRGFSTLDTATGARTYAQIALIRALQFHCPAMPPVQASHEKLALRPSRQRRRVTLIAITALLTKT